MLAVDKIVIVRFIQRSIDAPAKARQHHQLDMLVLQENYLILLVRFALVAQAICDGVGVNPAAGTLISTAFEEHWIGIGQRGWVGGDTVSSQIRAVFSLVM